MQFVGSMTTVNRHVPTLAGRVRSWGNGTRKWWWCVLVAQGVGLCVPAAASSRDQLTRVRPLPGSPWAAYLLVGPTESRTVYLAHDSQRKPVVLLLQGSGRSPLFTHDEHGFSGTTIFEDFVSKNSTRYHFALVEKRGVGILDFQAGLSHEEQVRAFDEAGERCSQAFWANDTRTARVDDAARLVQVLNASQWVSGIIVVGHSEGTQVATGLVKRLGTRLAGAGLLSSAGPTQFFGMYVAAGGPDRGRFRETFESMRMLQSAAPAVEWRGLPPRRWKSYALETTPLEDVQHSPVPLYVAHGGREGNILAADLLVLEAIPQQPGPAIRGCRGWRPRIRDAGWS
jgi:pimeloyl-ACP methyl ester carboxylesterase